MVIPTEPPVGPIGAAGHWPHHDWLSAAVKSLDDGMDTEEWSGYAAPNVEWFEPYPTPYAQGIYVHRIGRMVSISGMWRNKTAGAFPNAGVMGVVPAWARDSLVHIVLGLGGTNVSQRLDIEAVTGAMILRTPAGLATGAYIAVSGCYRLVTLP